MWDPLFIYATVEARNFKFGTQLRFGEYEYVTITTLVPNLVGAGWATGAPQKLWVSRTSYHVRYPVPRNSYRNIIKKCKYKCKNCGLDTS